MLLLYPTTDTDIKATTYEAKLADGSILPSFIQFDPINRKFTIRSNMNKNAGSYLIQLQATLTLPGYKPKKAPSAIIKVTISKGNKYPPAYSSDVPLFINITSLKNTNIKLSPIKDRDEDPFKLIKYTENVTSFFKMKGDIELQFFPTEDDEGEYKFTLALVDINPIPLFKIYDFFINVISQWPGRPKQSKTLNATVTAVNLYGELILTFNDDIIILDNYLNQTVLNNSVIKMSAIPSPLRS